MLYLFLTHGLLETLLIYMIGLVDYLQTSLRLFFKCGAFKFKLHRECLSKVCKRWSRKDSGFFNNIILVFFAVYE